jgi:hypothetical protein
MACMNRREALGATSPTMKRVPMRFRCIQFLTNSTSCPPLTARNLQNVIHSLPEYRPRRMKTELRASNIAELNRCDISGEV